jgi:hypothetical protein
MAFLRKITNREGHTYLSLVEGYRKNGKMKQRTLHNFGRLDILELSDPNALQTVQRMADEMIRSRVVLEKSIDLSEERNPYENKFVGSQILSSVYDFFGIAEVITAYSEHHRYKFDANDVLRLLTFSMIIQPGSKFATVENQQELFGSWNISQNNINRGLDHLCAMQEDIKAQIHKATQEKIGHGATLVFYDVNDGNFESDIDYEYVMSENGFLHSSKARPTSGWTEAHIAAHYLTCFVSLTILRVLQYQLGYAYSSGKIIEALRSAKAKPEIREYYVTEANDDFVNILKTLGVDWTKKYQSIDKIEGLAKLTIQK